jgi:hypothetical protein
MIDVEFDKENYSSIFCNYDWEKADPQTKLDRTVGRILVVKTKQKTSSDY